MEVKRQFRLRTFFIVVALVSFFLAGRLLLPGEWGGLVVRVYVLSLSTAFIFALWRAIELVAPIGKSVVAISLGSGIIAAACGSIIAVEITEDLRRIGYFTWSQDWPIVATHVVAIGAAGTMLGFFTVALIMVIKRFVRA